MTKNSQDNIEGREQHWISKLTLRLQNQDSVALVKKKLDKEVTRTE
jgi:hypothetical protein